MSLFFFSFYIKYYIIVVNTSFSQVASMTATFKVFMDVSLPCSVHFVYESFNILCIKQVLFFFFLHALQSEGTYKHTVHVCLYVPSLGGSKGGVVGEFNPPPPLRKNHHLIKGFPYDLVIY